MTTSPPRVTCTEEEWKDVLLGAVRRVLEQRNASHRAEESNDADLENRAALIAWARSHMAVGTPQRACFDMACRSVRSEVDNTTEGECCFSGLRHGQTYTRGGKKGKVVQARLVTARCFANVSASGERGRCEEVFTVEYEWFDFIEALHAVGNLKEGLEHAVARFIGPQRKQPLDAEETEALLADPFLVEARATLLAQCTLICNVPTRM